LRTLKLTIAYDGTEFAGYQRQARDRTVQAVLEDAVAPIEQRAVNIMAAGRTDAGVHAAAQVVSLSLENAISCADLTRALNGMLPADVRVIAIEEAAIDFSARREATAKTYHYSIWNGAVMPPLLRRSVWHVPQPLDLEVMSSAAALLVGEHDFAAFQARGATVKTTVRRMLASVMREIDVGIVVPQGAGGRLLRFEITGRGFLRHMVRTLAGTLVDIGRRRRAAEEMLAILASGDRARAGVTAPPHGLVLWRVEY
jgi:tRNA pseudouridine38-40 synthase